MATAPDTRKNADDQDRKPEEAQDRKPEEAAANRVRAQGEAVRAVESHVGEAAHKTSNVINATTRQSFEQTQEVWRNGLRSIASANAPLVSVGYDQGQRAIQDTLRITGTFREATERTAEDAHALTESLLNFGRGLQTWQHAFLDAYRQTFENLARKREEILRCKSLPEIAEVQRDLYVDSVGHVLASSTNLLQLSAQLAQDALRPLQERARAHRQN